MSEIGPSFFFPAFVTFLLISVSACREGDSAVRAKVRARDSCLEHVYGDSEGRAMTPEPTWTGRGETEEEEYEDNGTSLRALRQGKERRTGGEGQLSRVRIGETHSEGADGDADGTESQVEGSSSSWEAVTVQ